MGECLQSWLNLHTVLSLAYDIDEIHYCSFLDFECALILVPKKDTRQGDQNLSHRLSFCSIRFLKIYSKGLRPDRVVQDSFVNVLQILCLTPFQDSTKHVTYSCPVRSTKSGRGCRIKQWVQYSMQVSNISISICWTPTRKSHGLRFLLHTNIWFLFRKIGQNAHYALGQIPELFFGNGYLPR